MNGVGKMLVMGAALFLATPSIVFCQQGSPLVLWIKPDKHVYALGEPIAVSLTIRNCSVNCAPRQAVSVFGRGLSGPSGLAREGNNCEVTNSKGERLLCGLPTQPAIVTKIDFFDLEPNDNRTFQFDLYPYVGNQLKPDHYRLVWHYAGRDSYYEPAANSWRKVEHPWIGAVTSSVEMVQIVEKSELNALNRSYEKYAKNSKEMRRYGAVGVTWIEISETTAEGYVGTPPKEVEISFAKKKGKWRFLRLHHGKEG